MLFYLTWRLQAVNNFTFLQYSGKNNFVIDQRGHNTWIKGEASTFLDEDDPRLLLNTIVSNIEYSDEGVEVTMEDGSCISADYAVCTFSLGVLQHESAVEFDPPLPDWKKASIDMFNLGTYTKIFMQFPERFWPDDTEFFLYVLLIPLLGPLPFTRYSFVSTFSCSLNPIHTD